MIFESLEKFLKADQVVFKNCLHLIKRVLSEMEFQHFFVEDNKEILDYFEYIIKSRESLLNIFNFKNKKL
jgi:hypothetical protein